MAVMWTLAGLASLALLGVAVSRESISTARNRSSALRAAWQAEGCSERTRAVIGDALSVGDSAEAAWNRLDALLADASLLGDCDVVASPAGLTLDVNSADEAQVRSVAAMAGIAPSGIDSVVDALLDWRDSGDSVRQYGAEQRWYERSGRNRPRNAALVALGELRLVRGGAPLAELENVLGVEPGRILLTRAPAAVLAVLPGVDEEVLRELLARRADGRSVSLDGLAAGLANEGAARFAASRSALAVQTTTTPDAWIVTAGATVGVPPIRVAVELRLVRTGTRAAVVRRRTFRWL